MPTDSSFARCKMRLIGRDREANWRAGPRSVYRWVWDEVGQTSESHPFARAIHPPVVSMGETFDFAYTPAAPGDLRIEVRQGPLLLVRIPIRVQ